MRPEPFLRTPPSGPRLAEVIQQSNGNGPPRLHATTGDGQAMNHRAKLLGPCPLPEVVMDSVGESRPDPCVGVTSGGRLALVPTFPHKACKKATWTRCTTLRDDKRHTSAPIAKVSMRCAAFHAMEIETISCAARVRWLRVGCHSHDGPRALTARTPEGRLTVARPRRCRDGAVALWPDGSPGRADHGPSLPSWAAQGARTLSCGDVDSRTCSKRRRLPMVREPTPLGVGAQGERTRGGQR